MDSLTISEQIIRLLVAALAGMAIGFEREWREKAAGFRTLALVSLGAASFMLLAAGLTPDGPGRVAAGIVTGIGFLGAGAILREHGQVMGLTTAAAVWMAAALGMTAAAGFYALTAAGLVISLAVLLLSPVVDLTPVVQDARLYTVAYRTASWDEESLAAPLVSAGLQVTPVRVALDDASVTVVWRATGRPARHAEATAQLSSDPSVASIEIG